MNIMILCLCLLSMTATAPADSDLGFDRYGGTLELQGRKTGWLHVEEIGGRWYFVTPEGHGFFSLGATHAAECIRLDELTCSRRDTAGARLA